MEYCLKIILYGIMEEKWWAAVQGEIIKGEGGVVQGPIVQGAIALKS